MRLWIKGRYRKNNLTKSATVNVIKLQSKILTDHITCSVWIYQMEVSPVCWSLGFCIKDIVIFSTVLNCSVRSVWISLDSATDENKLETGCCCIRVLHWKLEIFEHERAHFSRPKACNIKKTNYSVYCFGNKEDAIVFQINHTILEFKFTDDKSKSNEGLTVFSLPSKNISMHSAYQSPFAKISFPSFSISWKFIRTKGPYTETSIFFNGKLLEASILFFW